MKEVNQHEQDFKEMFNQMNEVSEMLHGDDLYYMKQMKDISGVRMGDHFDNYEKIQANMMQLAEKAVDVMSGVAPYDNKAKNIANKAVARLANYKQQISVVDS